MSKDDSSGIMFPTLDPNQRVQNWLNRAPSPDLLSPVPDQDIRESFRSSTSAGPWYFPRSRSASPVLQETSSRPRSDSNNGKRVLFDIPDRYDRIVGTLSSVTSIDMDANRGRTAPREPRGETSDAYEPGRQPFHLRVSSQPQLPHLVDFGMNQPQLVKKMPHTLSHTRANSTTASQQSLQQAARDPTPDRGRKREKVYELESEESDKGLSPVAETTASTFLPRSTTMNKMGEMFKRRQDKSRDHSRSVSRHNSPEPSSSADAQARRRPAPLELDETSSFGLGARSNIRVVQNPIVSPGLEQGQDGQGGPKFTQYRSSSVYMDDTPLPYYNEPSPSPLYAPTKNQMMGRANSILQGYAAWKGDKLDVGSPMSGGLPHSQSTPAMEQGHPSEMMHAGDQVSLGHSNEGTPLKSRFKEDVTPLFTPLTPYLMHSRMRTKTMIGHKGWLEDTAEQKPMVKKEGLGIVGAFKKTARKIAAEMSEFRGGEKHRATTARELSISLDPREQSLLYCELEFILSNALSAYINLQLHSGRLNPHIHAKISDAWAQKGRPKVVGFRYDLETQIDMIAQHIGSFRFYGPYQTDPDIIKGCLYGMKVNARAMRIHTYCQPDSVVAKHILDAQGLLVMLDSPESVQVPLAEVSQFFKVVIEREDDARRKRYADKAFAGAEPAPNKGFVPETHDNEGLSPPKGRYPGEYRVKNQIHVPEDERDFSGPILEPKTYDPLRSNLPMGEEQDQKQFQ
ncbi:hypothetical protein F5B19DRAFT_368679 [Rostrohypoxylon terebratum]|nr:hypothetical protein F5B19DRAFT_368679 [Rostrohypoxylon terebratum]